MSENLSSSSVPPQQQATPLGQTANLASHASADPGRVVRYFGDYELLEEIARGGMGVVYRARQVSLNRVVAVKMIRGDIFAGPDEVRRFQAEAEAAANLDHPGIVPIHEVGEHQGQHYFSMAYAEGGSLAGRVGRPGTDRRWLVRVLAQVARAVHHAHQRGILHRDLKPANVLLDRQDAPQVADFGLAKRLEGPTGDTQSGAIVGTPDYLAPEQARAEKVLTTAVDVHGLGTILYELLTGRPPFRAATAYETILQVLEQEPPPPSRIDPSVDRDLDTICRKCLHKQPGGRYGTAEALADDLERWLRHEPIHARPVGPLERLARWARRRPAIAGLSALTVATTLVGAGLVLWQWGEAVSAERKARSEWERAEENGRELRAALARVQGSLYTNRLLVIDRYWREGRIDLARGLLAQCDRENRGWEWNYLYGQVNPVPARWFPDSDSPSAVQAAGPWVAGISGRTARVWDASSGATWFSFEEPDTKERVSALGLTPDGRHLVTGTVRVMNLLGGGWGTLGIHDLRTRQTVFSERKDFIWHLACSLDGRFVASCEERDSPPNELVVREVPGGKVVHRAESPTTCAFGPGLLAVALSNKEAIEILDTTTWKVVKTLTRGKERVDALAWGRDGKYLAQRTGGGEGIQSLSVWDLGTGKARGIDRIKGETSRLAVSPDGKSLAAGWGNRTIKVWNLDDLELLETFEGRDGRPLDVGFSPDGTRLYAAGLDNRLHVWNLQRDEECRLVAYPLRQLPHPVFPAGGSARVCGALDARDGKPPSRALVLEALTGKEVAAITPGGEVEDAVASPTGHRIVTHGKANGPDKATHELALWDGAGKRIATLHQGPEECRVWKFSRDGRLVRGSVAWQDRVWDAETGEIRPPDSEPRSKGLRFSVEKLPDSDRTRLHFGEGNAVEPGEAGGPGNPALSPDGKLLAAAQEARPGEDKVKHLLTVWDVETGEERYRLTGAGGTCRAFVFNATGTRLFAAGTDSQVKVWDTLTGQELLTLPHPNLGYVTSARLTLSPDERVLVLTVPKQAVYWLTAGW